MKQISKLALSIIFCVMATVLPQAALGLQPNDPIKWSANGNFYQVVLSPTPLSWDEAKNRAELSSFQGMSGHLATVTSEGENAFIKTIANGNLVWLGGKLLSVRNSNGSYSANWYWASGPENGIPFALCDQANASSCQSQYAKWDDSSPTLQPDMKWGEDSLAMIGEHPQTLKPGSWHDCANSGGCNIYGYTIEYESDASPLIQASSNLGFQGYQGRTEAHLDMTDKQLLVSGVSGPGKLLFLNPESLVVENEVNVPTGDVHFSYPLVSGTDIFLSNSFGWSGTWIRKYDSKTNAFGPLLEVCPKAGYDKGVAKDGLLYIPCTDKLVVLKASTMDIAQTLSFTGSAVQPAITKEYIWVPIHGGSLLKFDKNSGELIQSVPACSDSQSVHIVGQSLVCLELGATKVFSLDGRLLGQSSLPEGLGSYYRSQDESGIWISNLSQNLLTHYNPELMRVDKIVKTSGYSSGSVTYKSATYVATGDGKINRIGFYTPRLALTKTALIEGIARVGNKLSARMAEWDKSAQRSIQWQIDGEVAFKNTGSTYVLTSKDIGKTISFRVTAKRSGYQDAVTESDGVLIPKRDFEAKGKLVLTGKNSIGGLINSTPISFGAKAKVSMEWLRDGMAIPGALGWSYRPVTQDLGKQISLRVCASNIDFNDKCITLQSSGVTKLGVLSKRPKAVVVSKNVGAARCFEARMGRWDYGVAIRYEWLKNGILVNTEDQSTYCVTTENSRTGVQVRITATKEGYESDIQTLNVRE